MADSLFSQSNETERQAMPPERGGLGWWPWLAIAAAVLVLIGLRTVLKPPPEVRGEHPAVGVKLSTIALTPLIGDAKPVSADDLRGKVTLINFWGPWCGYCLVEFPHLVEIEKHFRDQPRFQFLSISANSDPRDDRGLLESTQEFLKQQPVEFPIYRDPNGETVIGLVRAAKIDGFGYPATVLLDDGVIRGLWLGFIPGDENSVRQAVEKALANKT